jgi:hypothetical protein
MDVLRTPDDRFVDQPDHASTATSPTPTSHPHRPLHHNADGSWDPLVPTPLVIDRSGTVTRSVRIRGLHDPYGPDPIEAALAALDWPERQYLRPAI